MIRTALTLTQQTDTAVYQPFHALMELAFVFVATLLQTFFAAVRGEGP